MYEGHPVDDPKSIEIKGIEMKRGDCSRLTRQLQEEVVGLILEGGEDPDVYERLVLSWRDRIMAGKVDLDDIVISKSLKDLGSYAVRTKKDGSPMTQAAHVEIAKRLLARGEDVSQGTRVRYIVTDASTSPQTIIPAADFTGEFDRFSMWTNVYEASIRVLSAALPQRNWQRWCGRRAKRSLKGQLSLLG